VAGWTRFRPPRYLRDGSSPRGASTCITEEDGQLRSLLVGHLRKKETNPTTDLTAGITSLFRQLRPAFRLRIRHARKGCRLTTTLSRRYFPRHAELDSRTGNLPEDLFRGFPVRI